MSTGTYLLLSTIMSLGSGNVSQVSTPLPSKEACVTAMQAMMPSPDKSGPLMRSKTNHTPPSNTQQTITCVPAS